MKKMKVRKPAFSLITTKTVVYYTVGITFIYESEQPFASEFPYEIRFAREN